MTSSLTSASAALAVMRAGTHTCSVSTTRCGWHATTVCMHGPRCCIAIQQQLDTAEGSGPQPPCACSADRGQQLMGGCYMCRWDGQVQV